VKNLTMQRRIILRCFLGESTNIATRIHMEEYILFKVSCGTEFEILNYIYFEKGKDNLLEIGLGSKSRTIKEISLLINRHFEVLNKKFDVRTYEEGCIRLRKYMSRYKCPYLKTFLYKDGIRIALSEGLPPRFFKMDKLYIGMSEQREIKEVCVFPLSKKEVEHTKQELEMEFNHYQQRNPYTEPL